MRIDPDILADTLLLKSPGWARVGLTAPDPGMRHQAAQELARVIIDEIGDDRAAPNPAQLGLAV
ncbi:DUF6771 family protein [Novosphingobium sp. Gsoil 351]|uniref:DUF6771 family protein n=1 Tax=Novosphingobium sp. Gsoil 351 TaxID=2675225 RepID=UPI0012B4848E|nr:DUF6771 family protein [Novosphingobium sp. Gsoil 351]QGN55476.1 hypothetical protein GKE62_13875 [Novosphingobium sp. Gsoil 351]